MFLLNIQSKVPIFEQIQAQMIRFIETGVLKEDDRLPSVRQLAKDNGINPNTVTKAYAMLEQNGYVYNIPKKGVYVAHVDKEHLDHSEQILSALKPLAESGISRKEIETCLDTLYPQEGGEHAEN
ncbi:MAG: GntR family transcriptional regulator [Solobacterium sp.]|nr:GntR family transcriptional regulator [Solobacterium sp.]MCI1346785.1 GntR family transcriptional regulator [Solobacterium sp.]MCI1408340.1 GntR family transcriptional regulator [Solobacterium sp.]MCI1436478.1 GntR family transcriptional regulator [Solobacterium sp.]MCI1458796.1 GntR family transcriptional regulator [Solobacterium sp.]